MKIWRRSFDITPPPLEEDDERNPRKMAQYRGIEPECLPLTESLATTIERTVPYFEEEIKPRMERGERVLIAAHGNSLRALMMHLEGISKEDILNVNLPTAVPLVYEFDEKFKLVGKQFLGDQAAIQAKRASVANQGKAT